MKESLKIAMYWPHRAEDIRLISNRFKDLFSKLQQYPHLNRWYMTGSSKAKANLEIDTSSEDGLKVAIRPLFKKNDPPLAKGMGYSMHVWNGNNEHSASIMAFCGAHVGTYTNSVVIDLLEAEPPRTEDQRAPYGKLIRECVAIFDPESAFFFSAQYILRNGGGGPRKAGGWLMYTLENGHSSWREE